MAAPSPDVISSKVRSSRRPTTLPPASDPSRLPAGACNFKDLSSGASAPQCGCQQFWDHGSEKNDASCSRIGAWCMCGHHACYHACHDRLPGLKTVGAGSAGTSRSSSAHPREPPRRSATWWSPSPTRQNLGTATNSSREQKRSEQAVLRQPTTHEAEAHTSKGHVNIDQPRRQSVLPLGHRLETTRQFEVLPSTAGSTQAFSAPFSASGLPPIPSECLMDPGDSRLRNLEVHGGDPAFPDTMPCFPNELERGRSHAQASGLGLSVVTDSAEADTIRMDTPASGDHRNFRRDLNMPWVDQSSVTAGADAVMSATEIATPSIGGTPHMSLLDGSDPTFEKVQALVDALGREVNDAQPDIPMPDGSSRCVQHDSVSESKSLASDPRNRSSTEFGHQQALESNRSIVSSLHRLMPHLSSLMTHLTAYPTLVNSLEQHAHRLESLENASYSNGPIEDYADKLDFIDGRLVDVETKVDDLDKWRHAADEDRNSDTSRWSRKFTDVDNPAKESFTSIASSKVTNPNASISSSAVIASAIDRIGDDSNLTKFESRLSELEHSAAPSVSRPLELEVIVLPWGHNLKGIWTSSKDSSHPNSNGDGLEPNEWTGARNMLGRSKGPPAQAVGGQKSGWDGAAIRRWANGAEEWMSPRACGSKGTVYERLKSRGMIQTVQITGGSAKDVQIAINEAFGNMSKILSSEAFSPSNLAAPQQCMSDMKDENLLGLRASFIPLRKVYRETQLQFLNPDEMISSSLWTTEFLASSVIMRAAGGRRRLFVTQRDAYLQYNRDEHATWNWQRLKELPGRDTDDLDAKSDLGEACWEWDPRLDPPKTPTFSSPSQSRPKIHASLSFRSRHSSPSDLDPQSSPSSQLSSHSASATSAQRHHLPITPLSEFPAEQQSRQVQNPQRTTSMPLLQPPMGNNLKTTKRRVTSQEGMHSSVRSFGSQVQYHKRRCLSRSHSPEPSMLPGQGSLMARTPKRSTSPSPFFSEPTLFATVGGTGVRRGGTPFAYATPHSLILTRNHHGRSADSDDADDDYNDNEISVRDYLDSDYAQPDPDGQDDDADDDYNDNEISVRDYLDSDYAQPDPDGQDDDAWEGVDENENGDEKDNGGVGRSTEYSSGDELGMEDDGMHLDEEGSDSNAC
ncbi:MAG: hypothetical protein M1837_003750 [Sclerophora amabilis]|nr:MAG: hypothetical protein M1837_003750 [Sclerophora amabilis]